DHDVVAAGHPVDELPVTGPAGGRGVPVMGLDGDAATAGPLLQTVPQAGGPGVAVDVEESDPVGGRQLPEPVGPQQSQARGDADAGGNQAVAPPKTREAVMVPCGPEVRMRWPAASSATAREPLPCVRTAMRTMSSSTSVIV